MFLKCQYTFAGNITIYFKKTKQLNNDRLERVQIYKRSFLISQPCIF